MSIAQIRNFAWQVADAQTNRMLLVSGLQCSSFFHVH